MGKTSMMKLSLHVIAMFNCRRVVIMIEVRACENNIGLGFSMFQPLLEDRNRQITWNLHAKLINMGI